MPTSTASASALWSAMVNRHGQPSSGQPEHRVDHPERHPVRGADGEHHEAPEDGGMHQSRSGSRNMRTWTMA